MAFSSSALRRAPLASAGAASAVARRVRAPASLRALPTGGCLARPAVARAPEFCAGYQQARWLSAAAGSVAERADSLIKEKPCVVFAKSTCPFCMMAREILEKTGAKHEVFNMDRDLSFQDVELLQQHLSKLTGARSVPRVFIGGKCIGGGDDTVDLHESGELKNLLEKAGAL
mmetsp:Transcript_101603/g.270214  ORF Transcript_101603/g.270214 Transcript_101603/m.270214 type:complete len:173 (-) Transcript_101603:63-581(-)